MRKKLPEKQHAKQYQEKMQLGWTIATLKEGLGINNKQLSRKTQLSYCYLVNLQGNVNVFPSFSSLSAIAKAFCLKPWQLLYLSEETLTKEQLMGKYYAFTNSLPGETNHA